MYFWYMVVDMLCWKFLCCMVIRFFKCILFSRCFVLRICVSCGLFYLLRMKLMLCVFI